MVFVVFLFGLIMRGLHDILLGTSPESHLPNVNNDKLQSYQSEVTSNQNECQEGKHMQLATASHNLAVIYPARFPAIRNHRKKLPHKYISIIANTCGVMSHFFDVTRNKLCSYFLSGVDTRRLPIGKTCFYHAYRKEHRDFHHGTAAGQPGLLLCPERHVFP